MAILGDFEEFEGPVPEPPYPYHQGLPYKMTGCSSEILKRAPKRYQNLD